VNGTMNGLVEGLQRSVESVSGRYHKLVLVIGSFGSGKTALLRMYKRTNPENVEFIGLNHVLTRRLIDIPTRQLPFESERCVNEVVKEYKSPILLVDNIEALFDPVLSLDPLRLLQRLSRVKTLVVAWPGRLEKGEVSYAEPGYKEYKAYSIKDLVVIDLNGWKHR